MGHLGTLTVPCLLLFIGRDGEIGADSFIRLAAGRDGRADAGERVDSRRDDGDGGRLHGGAVARYLSCVRRLAMLVVAIVGCATALFAATIGLVQTRHQESAGVFDDQPARLHVSGVRRGRIFGRDFSPDDPRVFQGAAVSGGGQRDSRDGRRAGHAAHGRAEQEDQVDVLHDAHGHAGDCRDSAAGGIFQQRFDFAECVSERKRRAERGAHSLRGGIVYGAAHFFLHVPANFSDVFWERALRRASRTRA